MKYFVNYSFFISLIFLYRKMIKIIVNNYFMHKNELLTIIYLILFILNFYFLFLSVLNFELVL